MKNISALMLACFVLSGCDPQAETPAGSDSAQKNSAGTLRYALWSSPSGNFHPELYFTDYDRAVIFVTFDRLVMLDDKQGFKPSLATRYDYSTDGKTLTFHLHPNIKWHDGQPFTAEDVAFTYQATASGQWPADTPEFTRELQGFKAYHNGSADHLSGIRVIDAHTVSFSFNQPYAAALSYFADRPVLAKHIWEKVPVAQWNQATALLNNPVGTGPFKVKKFVPDQYVELTRNEDYFKGKPALESLIFKVANRDTAQSELLNGELDVAELSSFNPADLALYKKAGVNLVIQNGVSGQYLTINHRDPLLADVRLREALLYGIDRQGIINNLLYGNGQIFNAKIHPQDPAYPDDLNPFPHSVEKANALLDAAGWRARASDGIRIKAGKRLAFTLQVPTGNRTREQSASIIQQNLKAIGVEITINVGDFNSTLAILQNPKTPFQLLLMGGMFRPGQYSNNYWWERFSDAQLTQLGDKANSTVDNEPRIVLLKQWAKRQNELAMIGWLYIPNVGYAVNPQVTGYHPYPYEAFGNVYQWANQPQ
ncbi:ABC transporter substrate-binding protein [Winslowiella iniecta]|uniref:ABC transporter substrate-binding protein n=1 Tax=Winslowiella iniecta TaxID=1560201 RepID=A0A0L7T2J3_9GAMM|nr:ABC transporter substrate-binding protein [Winslowiella iniecta]KOC89632.1 ABC transporter substrate-binding protein [Winslowiella iniecta]KOC93936.1 ABC transporter substrate-binding protein [Winslowiella iniecta]